MKKSMPVAAVFFAFAVAIVAVYLVRASGKKTPEVKKAAPVEARKDAWKTYEDKFVKFKFPPGWKAKHTASKTHPKNIWTVGVPDAMFDTGELIITRDTSGRQKRPLKTIYTLLKKNYEEKSRIKPLIGKPRMLSLKGGECLYHETKNPWNDVYVEADGRERIQRRCMGVDHNAHCYTDEGHYVSIDADQGGYCDRQHPDEKTQGYIDVYERVLRSLEFKSG